MREYKSCLKYWQNCKKIGKNLFNFAVILFILFLLGPHQNVLSNNSFIGGKNSFERPFFQLPHIPQEGIFKPIGSEGGSSIGLALFWEKKGKEWELCVHTVMATSHPVITVNTWEYLCVQVQNWGKWMEAVCCFRLLENRERNTFKKKNTLNFEGKACVLKNIPLLLSSP